MKYRSELRLYDDGEDFINSQYDGETIKSVRDKALNHLDNNYPNHNAKINIFENSNFLIRKVEWYCISSIEINY